MFRQDACAAVFAIAAIGCGADHDAGDPFDRELVVGESGGPAFEQGGPAAVYPPGPYGTSINSVVQNFELFGWTDPKASGFAEGSLERLQLADFYDPDGSKGSKVLVVSMAARWCGPCEAEYGGGLFQNPSGGAPIRVEPFAKYLAERYDRGVRMLGTISQDLTGGPADLRDLEVWAEEFDVAFPFGVDPAEKIGALRDSDGTWPIAFILTTQDMRVRAKISGVGIWDRVDRLLEE